MSFSTGGLTKREWFQKHVLTQIPSEHYVKFGTLMKQCRGKLSIGELRKFLGEAVKLEKLERIHCHKWHRQFQWNEWVSLYRRNGEKQ